MYKNAFLKSLAFVVLKKISYFFLIEKIFDFDVCFYKN